MKIPQFLPNKELNDYVIEYLIKNKNLVHVNKLLKNKDLDYFNFFHFTSNLSLKDEENDIYQTLNCFIKEDLSFIYFSEEEQKLLNNEVFSKKVVDYESELLNLKEVDGFIVLNNNSNFIILFGKYEKYQKEIKKIFKLLKDEESDYYEMYFKERALKYYYLDIKSFGKMLNFVENHTEEDFKLKQLYELQNKNKILNIENIKSYINNKVLIFKNVFNELAN